MLDSVLSAVKALLIDAGITAVREFPDVELQHKAVPIVCVGVKKCAVTPPGWGDYLGLTGAGAEVYGARAELSLGLDVYAPAPEDCARTYEAISDAFGFAPPGLKLRSLSCGETKCDGDTGLFVSRCEADCLALLERQQTAEPGEFTDFVLRGVMDKHEC